MYSGSSICSKLLAKQQAVCCTYNDALIPKHMADKFTLSKKSTVSNFTIYHRESTVLPFRKRSEKRELCISLFFTVFGQKKVTQLFESFSSCSDLLCVTWGGRKRLTTHKEEYSCTRNAKIMPKTARVFLLAFFFYSHRLEDQMEIFSLTQ